MKRKLLAVLLVLAMTLSLLPTAALAAETTEPGADSVASVTSSGTTTYYTTLVEAVKEAPTGATITLLKNCSGNGIGTFKNNAEKGVKDFTIDFNGKTYTCTGGAVGSSGTESQAFHLEWTGDGKNNANVTLKNGTLTSTPESGVRMLVQNYCNLTVDNMVLDGSNIGPGEYTLSNNCGNVTVIDTEIIAPDNGFAFDSCDYSSYTGVTVTVRGNSIIRGKIELTDPNGAPNNAQIVIEGGAFTDIPNAVKYAANDATIKLAENVSLDRTLVLNKPMTIDLDEKTISNGEGLSSYLLDNLGTLTLRNGTVSDNRTNETGTITTIRNLGTLTVGGMNISRESGIALKNDENGVGNFGTVTVSDSTITASGNGGQAIQNWGSVTITSGTFNGEVNAWASADWNPGHTTINGGTFNGDVQSLQWQQSAWPTGVATTVINNGVFNGGIAVCYQKGGPQPTVSTDKPDEATAGVMSVTGGTFSSKPAYVASGYHAVEDGSYTVHKIVAEGHAAVTATCTVPGNVAYFTCSGCGAGVYYSDASCTTKLDKVAIDAPGHSYSDAWTTNPDKHWHECSVCHAVKDEAAHTFEKSGIVGGEYEWTCNVCGYSKTGAADAHAIDTTKVTNGTVVAEPNPATVGQSVKLTLTPKDGYNDSDVQLYYSYADVVNAELSSLTFIMPDAAVTISGAFKPIEYKITYNLDGGTNSTANPSTYTVEGGFTLTAPTKSGYTFLGWSFNNNSEIIKEVSVKDGSTGNITFTAHWSYNGGGSSGGGGGSTGGSSSSTTTEKNPDGSTTTTTTDKTTGTVTEVTKEKDGTTTTVETKKDGTVTETVKTPTGTTGTVVTDKNGDVTEAKATVSTKAATEAAKTGEAVTLPLEVTAVKSTEDAPAVQVSVPKSAGSVKVEVPVEKVTPGTVAVIVNADGTEKIVSTSVVTENGVALTLDGSATVKIIDNSKTFTDVPADSVFYNEISSLSAREIMVGKTDDKFDLHSSVTLDQIANVAGRITGAVDVENFGAGVAWGADNGLKTGGVAATRGDVLKALYIAAGSPVVEDTSILSIFNDSAAIPADMAAIAAWAAQNGILKGGLDGNANLGVNVTRGQACALAGRTMGTLA